MEDPILAADTVEHALAPEELARLEEASAPYLGAWNQLISTTNWDKGKIIADWRNSLIDAGAPIIEYSDEAWARRVGGVTGQHVGRLRRVFERFGDHYQRYEGLFWSHFQAAVDWEDAEMWLEGAVQNSWSVASMRNQRWETLGAVEEDRPTDDIPATDLDEDFEPAQGGDREVRAEIDQIDAPDGPRFDGPDFGDEDAPTHARDGSGADDSSDMSHDVPLVQPFADLGSLPDDVMDAFESFKLAIIRHRVAGWEEISQADMINCLESLKVLVNAPSGVENSVAAPF